MSVSQLHSRTGHTHTESRARPPAEALAPALPDEQVLDDVHIYIKSLSVAVFALQEIRALDAGLAGQRATTAVREIVAISGPARGRTRVDLDAAEHVLNERFDPGSRTAPNGHWRGVAEDVLDAALGEGRR